MASRGFSIRSAAQATSSALRRLPIRWRLAAGSAATTFVILCGFAVVVGVLTTSRIEQDFRDQIAGAADDLQDKLDPRFVFREGYVRGITIRGPALDAYAAPNDAAIRVIYESDRPIRTTAGAPDWGSPRGTSLEVDGWRVDTRPIEIVPGNFVYVQYGRRIAPIRATKARVRVFLGLGVLGGTLVALIGAAAVARRAMSPITRLADTARTIARTRDTSIRVPAPEAEDEVAELARTLEAMLGSLDEARTETVDMLIRQREFIADASHELRTPLTSVLANLELLEEMLEGDARDAASSALRSTHRMRRLVQDLLLLARADTGRRAPPEHLDLSTVVAEAAGELEPVAGDHPLAVDARPGATVHGSRDELHRLVLNLMENALRHTDPGTPVEAQVWQRNGEVLLAVEDDGPGIPPELREKVFERFFRGSRDRGGSSGLGLAIVRAVAESHGGSVRLEEPLDGRGARFVVRLPAA